MPWVLKGHVSLCLEDIYIYQVHGRLRFPLFTFLIRVCPLFCHFNWTISKFENTEDMKFPDPEPNAVDSNKTTHLASKSSASSPTPEPPQHPTSSSLETHGAFYLQTATPAVSGRPAPMQITHERNPGLNGRPLELTGVKPACVPAGSVSERSTEHHTKFAAFHSSSSGKVTRLELERQLSVSLAAQTERDHRIAQLTDELALMSALLEKAKTNAVGAARRAAPELREHVDDRRVMWASLVKQMDVGPVDVQARLRDMQAKLDELLLSRDHQIGQYEKELANVRAKLEANESELEAVRSQVTDAERGLIKSKAEADTLRTRNDAGSVNKDDDQVTRGLMERMRALEAEMASRRWNEKSIEEMECRNEG